MPRGHPQRPRTAFATLPWRRGGRRRRRRRQRWDGDGVSAGPLDARGQRRARGSLAARVPRVAASGRGRRRHSCRGGQRPLTGAGGGGVPRGGLYWTRAGDLGGGGAWRRQVLKALGAYEFAGCTDEFALAHGAPRLSPRRSHSVGGPVLRAGNPMTKLSQGPESELHLFSLAWCLEACQCVRRSPSQAHSPDTSVAYAERQRRGVAPGAATRSSTQDHAGDESAAGAAGGLDQDVLPRAVGVAWPRWMLPAADGDSGEPASSGRASRHSIYRTENNVMTQRRDRTKVVHTTYPSPSRCRSSLLAWSTASPDATLSSAAATESGVYTLLAFALKWQLPLALSSE